MNQPWPPGQPYGQQQPDQPYGQPNQPYQGAPGRPYPGQPQPGPQQPGQLQPGQPQPGQPYPGQAAPGQPYGGPGYGRPDKPGGGAAVLAGLLFLPAVIYTLIAAFTSWDGRPDSLHLFISVLGMAFAHDVTGNVDFAITVSMIVAPIVLVLALLLVFRVPAVRWALTVLGALCAIYYVYAVIKLLTTTGGGEFVILPVVALLLWLVPTFVAALPPVGRATRRTAPQPFQQQPPYQQQQWR
ncbi:hypothetical protein ABZ816_29560 [Actinosynnema sp. NPDC047251]|uniref:Putative membrane protein n=1 Tax=Saccharothrix espanaensis (strain ATCC 51144 / DSM 44229 / JCM 9112 / NBRC 15066 / NRRL 15764) TaxID=1179773 RepID=K0KE06_SACES|nr:hypothetical protein [Saccharothrix espanaensis]CCH34773.1 putative membrane protein [Saccharothrix espanaensis DSM 44229]